MPVYSIEGKLGTGKTLFAVYQARQAMAAGRPVASNVDLNSLELWKAKPAPFIRVPDRPTAADLEALPHGNPNSYDEDNNGVLILDELGTWLNSRSFQGQSRQALIDWLIHARKHGWDVFLIVQNAIMIDKQVRESLIEYECRCLRLDKVRIPVVGGLLNDLGVAVFGKVAKRWGYLPKGHIVTARVGHGAGAFVAQRWMFRGQDLWKCYDTRQVFRADYPHGTHSVLVPPSPPEPVSWIRRLFAGQARPKVVPKPKARAVQLAASLGREQAWRWAARYTRQLDRGQAISP